MRQRYMFFTVTLAGLVGSLMLATVGHADQITRGQMLSLSCAGCHGPDGQSPGSIPSIAGKEPAVMEKTLKEFRDGKLDSTMMIRHMKGYTDEEIKLIAQYFASLK